MIPVSVIIPAYNARANIQQCLSSLGAQTLENIEIIAVDDGSHDPTGRILDLNAQLDSRIKVVHLPHGGMGKALNAGLEQASGDYVSFLRADDFAVPEAFATLYDIAWSSSADMVECRYFLFNDYTGYRSEAWFATGSAPVDSLVVVKNYPDLLFAVPDFRGFLYKRDMLVKNGIKFTESQGACCQQIAFAYKTWCVAQTLWLASDFLFYCRMDDDNPEFTLTRKRDCIRAEYDAALDYALQRQSPFMPHIQKQRYLVCCENYKRIHGNARNDYIGKLSGDFRNDIDRGLFPSDMYGRKEAIKFRLIAHHPQLFHLANRLRLLH